MRHPVYKCPSLFVTEINDEEVDLRVIRFKPQIGEQQRLSSWLRASTLWLYCHKHRVEPGKRPRAVAFQYPAFLACVVLIEEPETDVVLARSAASPCLEYAGVFEAGLLVKIVAVEDQRFVLRVEDTSERLFRGSGLRYVVYLGYI